MRSARTAFSFRDHYDILGVEADATDIEIKAAFWELAKRHHPDVSGGGEPAARRFAEISEARSVLLSPSRRAAFDRERAAYLGGDLGEVVEIPPPPEPLPSGLLWRGLALLLAGLLTVLVTVRFIPLATLEALPAPTPVGGFDGGVLTGVVCCAACAVVAALAWPARRGHLPTWRWEVLLALLSIWLCASVVGQFDPHLLLGGLFSADLTSAEGGYALVLGVSLMLGGVVLIRPRVPQRSRQRSPWR
jgi:hypothetical protein